MSDLKTVSVTLEEAVARALLIVGQNEGVPVCILSAFSLGKCCRLVTSEADVPKLIEDAFEASPITEIAIRVGAEDPPRLRMKLAP